MGLEAAIVGGIIAATGSVAAAGISSAGAMATNETNQELAKNANDVQINLANTAHQREVNDLRAAGLNPILAANGGGSDVPNMHVPTVANPLASIGDAMKNGISDWSAIKSGQAIDTQVENTKADTRLKEAQALLSAAQVNSANAAAREADARIPMHGATTRQTEEETVLKRSGVLGRTLGSDAAAPGLEFVANTAETIGEKLNDLISNINVTTAKKVKPHNTSPRSSSSRSSAKEPRHDGSLEHLLPQGAF